MSGTISLTAAGRSAVSPTSLIVCCLADAMRPAGA
jgi:hypothetical protein